MPATPKTKEYMNEPEINSETAPVAKDTGTAKKSKITLHSLLLALVVGSPIALMTGSAIAIATDLHTFKVAVGLTPPSSMVVKPIVITTPNSAQGGVK